MKQTRSQKRSSRSTKGAKALQRAIAKSNPTKEPPTVGKPVIVDPAEPRSRPEGSKTGRKRSRKDDAA
jgi:hypothetical protein